MNKIIISGADGFVGSYTVEEFLKNGIKVIAIDLNKTPKRLISRDGLDYVQMNVFENPEQLINKFKHSEADTFIHFAWAGSAGPQRTDYNLQLGNAVKTVECLKAAKEIGCKRFVCAGSIMEYEIETAVHANGSRPGMGYIYGMGKHVAHCLCKSVAAQLDIDLLWPMITNAYGIGEYSPRFINTTLRKIINHEPLEFTAATQNYDFVYVSDVARAFYLVAERGLPFSEYMIGSGNAAPLRNFIKKMVSACDCNAIPIFGNIPFTGVNMPLSYFSIDNIEKDCGFKPSVSFEEGTIKTMEWLKTIKS